MGDDFGEMVRVLARQIGLHSKVRRYVWAGECYVQNPILSSGHLLLGFLSFEPTALWMSFSVEYILVQLIV